MIVDSLAGLALFQAWNCRQSSRKFKVIRTTSADALTLRVASQGAIRLFSSKTVSCQSRHLAATAT
jgi:hypothetical protein